MSSEEKCLALQLYPQVRKAFSKNWKWNRKLEVCAFWVVKISLYCYLEYKAFPRLDLANCKEKEKGEFWKLFQLDKVSGESPQKYEL